MCRNAEIKKTLLKSNYNKTDFSVRLFILCDQEIFNRRGKASQKSITIKYIKFFGMEARITKFGITGNVGIRNLLIGWRS